MKPHLVKGFKVSNDPVFEKKAADIVGLYLDPPDRAVVLCVMPKACFQHDEKSRIQTLDRTRPGLPLKKGRAATMTHDYKRHGTTTLFAALAVKSGKVIGDCMPRHRATEFLKLPHATSPRPGPRAAMCIWCSTVKRIRKQSGGLFSR